MTDFNRPMPWPHSSRPFLSNPPDGSVGVALPMRDNLKFFKLAFHSILDFTDSKFIMAIVDNMSGAKVSGYLEGLRRNHNVNVLKYQKDHNLAAEANLAFRFMFSFENVKYGALVTPDIVVEPDWMRKLMITLMYNERIGIVGPATSFGPVQQQLERGETLIPTSSVGSFCMMFKRKTFEDINGFDEIYMDHGYEDSDFCYRAEKAGWGIAINPSVFVHRFSKSGMSPDPITLAKNAAIFDNRTNGAVPT